MSELPLFPLQTVLLPGGRLALRVFEARYLDMVARCLRGANRFGVVAIREGAEVGTATTYDARHERRDRRLAPGARRPARHPRGRPRAVSLARRRGASPTACTSAAWRGSTARRRNRCRPRTSRSRRCCGGSCEPLPLYRGVAPSFDDAAWVGGRLIELLPLAARAQAIAARDARIRGERLERLAAALDRAGASGDVGS